MTAQLANMSPDEKKYILRKLDVTPGSEEMTPKARDELIENWLKDYRNTPTPVPVDDNTNRQKLQIPESKSVIAEVREAMRAFPKHSHEAAKLISMGNANFLFLRRLITIYDKSFLPREDKEAIDACFEYIEKNRRVGGIRRIGQEIIAKHLNGRWRIVRSHAVSHRRKRFDQTVLTICESCESSVNMELPDDVSKDDVLKAIGSLSKSIELIGKLVRRLVGDEEK